MGPAGGWGVKNAAYVRFGLDGGFRRRVTVIETNNYDESNKIDMYDTCAGMSRRLCHPRV